MTTTETKHSNLTAAHQQQSLLCSLPRDLCGQPRIWLEENGTWPDKDWSSSAFARQRAPDKPLSIPVQNERILGCLFAGAAGDALGVRVEFMFWENRCAIPVGRLAERLSGCSGCRATRRGDLDGKCYC